MASTVKIKRRIGGPAGAPSSLLSGEPAWNDAEQIGYIGGGDNGSGLATSIPAIFGFGAYVARFGNQTIDGSKTFNESPIVPAPTQDNHAANKAYVDLARQGITAKAPARAATTGNITLSGAQTIDGVSLVAGDRVLVKNQSTAAQNGLYVVAAGAWTRADDASDWNELVSAVVFVSEGTTQSDTGWQCTINKGGTLGTTAIAWAQFTGGADIQAGDGLSKSGNVFSVSLSARLQFTAGTIDLAPSGATAGSYRQVTIDQYGRVTGGSNPSTLAGYGIGDAQPLNNKLTAFAGLTGSVDKIAYFTGAETLALATLTSFIRGLLDDADAATAQSTLGLVIGTNVQAFHANLQALAGLVGAADRIPYFSGSGAMALQVFTSFARQLLDDADAAAARTTLGLGSIATQAANAVSITGGTIGAGVTVDATIDGGTF